MRTAADFLPTFFQRLTQDGQIDRAVAVARGASREQLDAWLAVLFLRSESGRLWVDDAEASAAESAFLLIQTGKGIQQGPGSTVKGDVFTGGKRVVNTGGGPYYEKEINVSGGTFVGRDQHTHCGATPEQIAQLFAAVLDQIQDHPVLTPDAKADLAADVKQVQAAIATGPRADDSFIARRLRNLQRMAPDILDVVLKTLANPLLGLPSVAEKVAARLKQSGEGRTG